jgi:hypothetical protein
MAVPSRVFDAGSCLEASPHTGNVHVFAGESDCAILDVIAPPYDEAGGRPCTYFDVVGGPQVLESTPAGNPITLTRLPGPPRDFHCPEVRYAGMQ